MMIRPAVAVLALSALAVVSCKKKDDSSENTASSTAAVAPKTAEKPATPPPPTWDVAFKGKYNRTAKVTFKNGQRVRMESTSGIGTMTVVPGKATYYVEYASKGKTYHVTQTYTFTQGDVRPVAGGGFDVPMKFEKMDSDDKSWNPDSKDPKLEARKQGSGWEIGFLVRDTAGVQGGMEFR